MELDIPMKKLLLALVLSLAPSLAFGQCNGIFPANTLCGNLGASPAPPSAFTASGTVVGPGSSTVNDIATFSNTSGTQIKDSGVLMSNVPLLNGNNTFSGNNTFTGTNSGVFTNIPSNNLNSQTIGYSIATTDCGSTIQAGTGSTGQFTVTLPAVAGFPTTCSVEVKNSDTARAKILSGFPADVATILWPLQSVGVKIVNGAWASFNKPGRWQPTGAITFHVNSSTGSDTNNDCLGTTSGACNTANHAMLLIANYIDNINGVTIQWDTSTTANFTALTYTGPGTITLNGNSSATINVSSAPGGAVINIGQEGAPVYGNWVIEGLTIQSNTNAGIYGIICAANTQCELGTGMNFQGIGGGVTFPGAAIAALYGANLKCASFTVTSNWSSVMEADDFGRVDCAGVTVTFVSAPFFNTATIVTHGAGAIVSIPSITWSGSVTAGIKRYAMTFQSLIDSGACASIPGSVAGTPAPDTLGSDGAYCN